jgi:thymidylate kinase
MEDTRKGDLFRDVVEILERAGHDFCVLHGYEDYPENIRSDIDAISRNPEKIPHILSEDGAVSVIQAIDTQPAAALWLALLRWYDGEPVIIRLHVFRGDYRIDGRVFFEGEEFLSNCRDFKFFKVPPPALEFAAYLVKRTAKGSLDEEQGSRLSRLYAEDPTSCMQYLTRLLPEDEVALVAEAARTGSWKTVRDRAGELYQHMAGRVARERPVAVSWNRLGDRLQKLRRAVRPPGLMVAFLGVDGAGKSTVMARLERDLAPAFWSTSRYHGRALESPLRWTKRVRAQRQLRDQEIKSAASTNAALPSRDPHNKPSRGLLLSILKLTLWWADYTFLGYLRDVYPNLRRGALVLFDRYYQDLLVDPRRHRYGGPLGLARFAGRFFPRPHLTILLDAPPEVLHSRKQEVSVEETSRQREAYLRLVKELPDGHVVDASRPVAAVVSETERILLEYLATREARKLKG